MYRHKLQQHQTKLKTNPTTKTTKTQLPNTNPITFKMQLKNPQKIATYTWVIRKLLGERINKYVNKNIVVKSQNGPSDGILYGLRYYIYSM